MSTHPDKTRASGAGRRLKALRLHFLAYLVLMAVLVGVNFVAAPGDPWFVWPMVGWGGVLAIHVAYAMGLFGSGASGEG